MVSSDYNSKQIVELDRSKWDYVPSIGLWVAKEKILFGRVSFYNAQKKLYYSNNQKIPTIPEFREFLKYTKENDKEVYNKIIYGRSSGPEFLDAKFKKEEGKWIVYFHNFDEKGKIVEKFEELDENTLMDEREQISLDNLLEYPTKQGLPTNRVPRGVGSSSVYYTPPQDFGGSSALNYCLGGINYPWVNNGNSKALSLDCSLHRNSLGFVRATLRLPQLKE
ncbi:MAG: hypothetical protein KJ949_03395 [Nanoarchaeota archaeon]|nr:hypothetical protein [Nanoarchaeota archaeon]MBU4308684.1 hypothetical protein [Nanoarchaeota archaeon]